jgi:hypothetical protein
MNCKKIQRQEIWTTLKNATKYAVRQFRTYLTAKKVPVDFENFSKAELDTKLCMDLDVTHKILYEPMMGSIQYFVGDTPVHKLPFGPKCHEIFVISYSIKPTSKYFVHLP